MPFFHKKSVPDNSRELFSSQFTCYPPAAPPPRCAGQPNSRTKGDGSLRQSPHRSSPVNGRACTGGKAEHRADTLRFPGTDSPAPIVRLEIPLFCSVLEEDLPAVACLNCADVTVLIKFRSVWIDISTILWYAHG